jgi:putative sigma-54 modulation protein
VDSVQISISTRHGHVSDKTQLAIREKFERLTRLYDRVSAVEFIIDLEHPDAPSVDLKVSAKKHEFVATAQAADLASCTDVVIEKMEQQLRKHKEKVQDRHRGTGHRQAESSDESGEGRTEE